MKKYIYAPGKITERREKLGIKVSQLEKLSGITIALLMRYEEGSVIPSAEKIATLATTMKVTPNYFFRVETVNETHE